MRSTAWLLLATLLAEATLLVAPLAHPARAEEVRTVTLRVAADETYRARDDWPDFIQSLEQKAPSH